MIKIHGKKIKHQPKNKNLLEIVIILKKEKKNHAVYFLTNPVLKDKIEKKLLKTINKPKTKKTYPASGCTR
jgi:uncharacterized membrane protein YheB (UPF0754 family)